MAPRAPVYVGDGLARNRNGRVYSQCTFVLDEVMEYYNKHASPVFLVTFYATKAFDRVE